MISHKFILLYKATLLVIISLSSFFIFFHRVYADGLFLTVYPSVNRISVVAGRKFQIPIKITNYSYQTISLSVFFKSFQGNQDGSTSFTIDSKTDQQFGDFVKKHLLFNFDGNKGNTFMISPQETKTIIIYGTTDLSDKGKDYYFSIFFKSNIFGSQINGSYINGAIASNVLLSISPSYSSPILLKKFSIPFFHFYSPHSLTFYMTNNSPHYITLPVLFEIEDFFGKKILEKTNTYDLLKYSQREVTMSDLDLPNLPFGYYHVSVFFQSNNITAAKKTSFMVLPVKLLFIFAFISILIFITVYRTKKKMK